MVCLKGMRLGTDPVDLPQGGYRQRVVTVFRTGMAGGMEIGLAQLLVSHLCHELVSPIGAINNGVELLEELPPVEGAQDVVSLIGQSGRNGAAKLRFYRLAYGLAGANAGVPAREARLAATELFAGESRVRLVWPEEVMAQEYPARGLQLVLNLMLLGSEFLSRGGSVTLSSIAGEAAEDVVVTVRGAHLRIDETVPDLLAGRDVSPSHRGVNAAYCFQLARAVGTALTLDQRSADEVDLRVRVPLTASAP